MGEHQWEILRLRREKEAEEEMKEQIKINEEALMESLQRLGKEKEKKDSENEKLREQLKVLKEKLTLESALRQTLEGEKQKEENIKRKEAERQICHHFCRLHFVSTNSNDQAKKRTVYLSDVFSLHNYNSTLILSHFRIFNLFVSFLQDRTSETWLFVWFCDLTLLLLITNQSNRSIKALFVTDLLFALAH